MKEKCGLYGLYLNSPSQQCARDVVSGLELLQHRGQEGAGLAYTDNNELVLKKGLGLVKTVFNDVNLNINTNKCIGHVRYSTSGNSKSNTLSQLNECQPLKGTSKYNEFYLAHNGNIPQVKEHDTQYIINFLENKHASLENNLITLLELIPVAYCLLIITNNEMYVVRDRYGIRPLSVGFLNKDICVTSETCALGKYNYLREVLPGEIIKIDNSGLQTLYKSSNTKLSICALEFIYFMRPNSFSASLYVADVRKKLAILMAEKEDLDLSLKEYIVIGIPFSGILYGQAYAEKLNLQYKQLINKVYDKRTFIAPTNKERNILCNSKFAYDYYLLKDKNIIIIDDSIVRGNVIKTITKKLYDIGVSEIHIRIPSPPIVDRCQLGIDIVSKNELLATNKKTEDIAKILNVDSIKYLTCEELKTVIPENSYMECFGEQNTFV